AGGTGGLRLQGRDELLELGLDAGAAEIGVRGGGDGAGVMGARGGSDMLIEPREKLGELAVHVAGRQCVRRAGCCICADARGAWVAGRGGGEVVNELVDRGLHVCGCDEAARRVLDMRGRMATGGAGEVVAELGVDGIEGRL